MPLAPKPPQLGDRLFRALEGVEGRFTISRLRCILVRPDGSSRYREERADVAGRFDNEEEARDAADRLNRCEPWFWQGQDAPAATPQSDPTEAP